MNFHACFFPYVRLRYIIILMYFIVDAFIIELLQKGVVLWAKLVTTFFVHVKEWHDNPHEPLQIAETTFNA